MNMLGISALGNFPSVSDTLGEVYNTVCFYFLFFFLQCTGLLKVSEASLGLESNIVEYLLGQKKTIMSNALWYAGKFAGGNCVSQAA